MTCRKWPRMSAVAESPPMIAPTMNTATTPDHNFHLPFRFIPGHGSFPLAVVQMMKSIGFSRYRIASS